MLVERGRCIVRGTLSCKDFCIMLFVTKLILDLDMLTTEYFTKREELVELKVYLYNNVLTKVYVGS